MTINSHNKSDSTMDILEKILHWLEHKPSSWIILGLLIFLVSSGGVTLQLGDNSFTVGEPKNVIFQAVLLCLGIIILFVGLGLIITRNFKYRNYLLSFLIASTLIPQYFIIIEVIKNPSNHKSIRTWEYNSNTNEIEIELSSVALESYENKKLVLAVRKKDPLLDSIEDVHVSLGNVFLSPNKGDPNMRKNIKCSDLNPIIGDKIEVHLLMIDDESSISNLKTISDILKSGGKHIDMSWLTIPPDLKNPKHLYQFYDELMDGNKKIFRNMIKQ